MLRNQRSFSKWLPLLVIGIFIFASFFVGCYKRPKGDIDVTSNTTYSGTVNGNPIEIDVLATFNTGRGGDSTCKFTKLPPAFNPATLGTHT